MIDDYFPKISRHLSKYKINPNIVFSNWAISLFSHAVPLEFSEQLWGVILTNGWTGFFQILYGVIKVLEDKIMSSSDISSFTNSFVGLLKPKNKKGYAIEVNISNASLECYQLWKDIFRITAENELDIAWNIL